MSRVPPRPVLHISLWSLALACGASLLVGLLYITLPALAAEDPGWPREYGVDGDSVLIYQPQIDAWQDRETLVGRAAVAVTKRGTDDPVLGAVYLTADTQTNFADRVVRLYNLQVTDIRFPNTAERDAELLGDIVRTALGPDETIDVALERVIAAADSVERPQDSVEVNLDPPPIYTATAPAILVILMGEPQFEAIEGTQLLFCVNTNWDLFLDIPSSRYYLLNGDSWITTADLMEGPWDPVTRLPRDFERLPNDENWATVRTYVPGRRDQAVPQVFVSLEPAELIVLDGPATLTPIPGARLLYVTNTDSDLFLCTGDGYYYFLTAGRWFRAKALEGPWSAATLNLPPDFAKIPPDHARGHVLYSVPGTAEAEDAVMLASVPRKATVRRSEATVDVVYEGEPEFVEIERTTVYYAVNTPYDVFRVGGLYYCCYDGIWFEAVYASGPWVVCTGVPAVIYTIPPRCPKYHVTYVRVYSWTPDVVVVGYTAGYTGHYVYGGILVFGLGFSIEFGHPHWHHHYYPYVYHPRYFSYGCRARFDYYRGCYVRTARYYGPYGGAGRAAWYSPRTRRYVRGPHAYGPVHGAYAVRAHNAYTGPYRPQADVSTTYGAWSRSVAVAEDARGRGRERARVTEERRAAARPEAPRPRQEARPPAPARRSTATRSPHGDVYVGRDGNVYRYQRDIGWQRRESGAWTPQGPSQRATVEAQERVRERVREPGAAQPARDREEAQQRARERMREPAATPPARGREEVQQRARDRTREPAAPPPARGREEAPQRIAPSEAERARRQAPAPQRSPVPEAQAGPRAQPPAPARPRDEAVYRDLNRDAAARERGNQRAAESRQQRAMPEGPTRGRGESQGRGRGR